MSGVDYERELRDILRDYQWIVIRSAGSFSCDIVAVQPNKYRLIEVKSTISDKFYTSSDKEQFDLLNNYAKEGIPVYYYIRWIGGKRKPLTERWTAHKLPMKPYPIFRRKEK